MKKSKFLKKSLAMLLALMLVVAMIPLSAAAEQAPSSLGLRYITVNGNTVDLTESSPTVQVTDLGAAATVKLTADLKDHYELWALSPDGISHEEITTRGEDVPASYFTVNGDTATFKLAVVDTKGDNMSSNDKQYEAWTITLEKVTAAVTTNVEVTKGAGVAKVDKVDNENKIVYLTLARHTGDVTSYSATPAKWEEDVVQDGLNAVINIKGLEGATINGTTATSITLNDADNGKTFQVTSASKGNTSTFTIVAKYEDALDSFSVDGAKGLITDENKDDVPDTITVTLPKDAILDKWGHAVTDPSFVVEYAALGDEHCTVEIKKWDGTSLTSVDSSVATKDEVKFAGLTDAADWAGTVTVTRWGKVANGNGKAVQAYNLIVKLEDSTETGIEYVRVNTTEATASGDTSFHAVLPKKYNGNNQTLPDAVNVVIRTIPSITGVQINNANNASGNSPVVNMEKITSKTDPDYVSGQTAWKLPSDVTINATGTVVITLTAEDGSTKGTYTLTTEMAQANTDASITAFYIGDHKAQLTKSGGVNQEDIFTVTVPYMTLDVANLPIYATPSAGAKVQFTTDSGTYDLVNGYHTASDIPASLVDGKNIDQGKTLGNQIPTSGYLEAKVTAVDKSDETVKQDYIIRVQLSTDIATGNRLETLDFTAQPTSNNNDRAIMHAIDEDENVFKANVWENTDTSNNVGTINLYVPRSLIDNEEGTYNNVVLDYTTKDRGVAFAVINGDVNSGDIRLAKLSRTENDQSTSWISGTVINSTHPNMTDDIIGVNKSATDGSVKDGWNSQWNTEVDTIVVLPEKIARAVEGGYAHDTRTEKDVIESSKIWEYGTVYSVKIEPQEYKHDRDLISFKVGSSVLTVNKAEGTIEGTLNWADTADKATAENAIKYGTFADFEISKYAMLINDSTWNKNTNKFETTPSVVNFFPNGDVNGDGEPEKSNDTKQVAGRYVNREFLFVRNADYSVTVYRCDDNGDLDEIDSVKVLAEDRLDSSNTTSSSKWTFNLKWKDACDDADIETFSINGVSGQVDNSDSDNRTITVNLPYGTPITGLVADFTTSPNAKVTLTTPDGVLVESGITSLNYTEGVLLYVTSESGENKNSYRVTVELGNHFSDIDENDWYYDNVMDAANNGYISGMGDGTFAPTQATTRAQFASMIANAMGYEADPDVASMFPDVADDFWGKAAINFCAQNGIITGYDDGTFQPNKAITRQEAASILRNAFKLTES
ncbi:MAG: S-layer homology domain-containing protein, partial [Acutalibacter sp.]